MLVTLPKDAKWLVVHGLYIKNPSVAHGAAKEDDVIVLISCYGDMGAVVPSLGPAGSADFGNRMATYTAVRNWISGYAQKGRLIVGHEFKGW